MTKIITCADLCHRRLEELQALFRSLEIELLRTEPGSFERTTALASRQLHGCAAKPSDPKLALSKFSRSCHSTASETAAERLLWPCCPSLLPQSFPTFGRRRHGAGLPSGGRTAWWCGIDDARAPFADEIEAVPAQHWL
jgi:hypothetical protein